MALSVGIVGLPNVGKSTLFNALTKKSVPAENFPFCTIDPSVGVVAVPDSRLGTLARLSQSEKTIPAHVSFVDIAGLVRGAAQGEGLGNQFLHHIRETDAIAHVVRIFEDPTVQHVHGAVDPRADIEVINTELAMADIATVEKRLAKVEKEARTGAKEAREEKELLLGYRTLLTEGKPARLLPVPDHLQAYAAQLHLLTQKPVLYVLNKKSGALNLDEHPHDPRWGALREALGESPYVVTDAGIEAELADVAEEDLMDLRRDFGVPESGTEALIRASYALLSLITFFTTGEKETRAWTIRQGARAPEAGAAIHTDFRDKFIRAEVVPFDALRAAGSWAAARAQGAVRLEGKEYEVQDGDVMLFRIGT